MASCWFRVANVWSRVPAPYTAANTLLWRIGHSRWNPNLSAHQRRIIVVYEQASNGDYIVQGTTTDPLHAELAINLTWEFPPWNPAWTMPDEKKMSFAFLAASQELTLDEIGAAIRRVWNKRLLLTDFYNLQLQQLLCYMADFHRPGMGDAFERHRLELHRRFFQICMAGAGERAMLQYIVQQHNWGDTRTLLRQIQTPATDADFKAYETRHGPHSPQPSLFFEVAPWNAADQRIAHLDLPAWIWEMHGLHRLRLFQLHYGMREKYVNEQLHHMFTIMWQTRPDSVDRPRQRNATGLDVDIEDLIEKAAPCFKNMLESETFPKDGWRNKIARAMIAAGISLETGERLFHTLDIRERGPSTTVEQTRVRFAYPNEWEKQYAPDMDCERLSEICPYVKEGDTVGQRCAQCHADLYAKRPEIAVQVGSVEWSKHAAKWGPYKWWKIL
jgi:hypothetical protein